MRDLWAQCGIDWVQNERIFDAVFEPITAAIVSAADLQPGQRVLDIGCGSGTLLAEVVAAGATAAGVDISPAMVEAAARRVPEAAVVVGDAQTDDLAAALPGAPFDRIVSRFGVMFFADPVEAFANIGRASMPGVRLAFACWRTRAENPMFTLGSSVLESRLAPVPAPPVDAPGPMAFADPDRVTSVLSEAGWTSIQIEPVDAECNCAIDTADGVEERLTMILSTTTGRAAREQLESTIGPAAWADLLGEVRAELRRHLVDGTVRFPAATWLVTASRS